MKIVHYNKTDKKEKSYKFGPLWYRPNEYKMLGFYTVDKETMQMIPYKRIIGSFYLRSKHDISLLKGK